MERSNGATALESSIAEPYSPQHQTRRIGDVAGNMIDCQKGVEVSKPGVATGSVLEESARPPEQRFAQTSSNIETRITTRLLDMGDG